jgi:hypothetical protein
MDNLLHFCGELEKFVKKIINTFEKKKIIYTFPTHKNYPYKA